MKKILFLLLILPFITLFSGCNDLEEIVFDHEKQQFPIKENAILLEVITPTGSLADDEYYIIGDFNGGEDAIGNPEWRLEKAPESKLKWGIYLSPSSFLNGKTLADGFTFYAKKQGGERSVKDEPVTHTLDVKMGSFTNVWVDRWESYFGNVEKKSYSVYVDNQTGWEEIALYGWGDVELGGGWPGMLPTGTEEINGVVYTVFDLGEETKDLTVNLIFNNNNGGKQFDALQGFTINRDLYLRITGDSFEEVDPNVSPYLGYTVYVDNQSGWDELALYAWGDAELGGGWPGIQPTGTKEINGVNYTYFEMGEEMNDKTLNLIFNNNGNGKQFDALTGFVINRDVYLRITANSYEEIDPNGTPYLGYTVYVDNKTGWDELSLYSWGDVEPAGWPGLHPTGTKEINGVSYTYFEMGEEANGKLVNLIFNNNGNGKQLDALQGFTLNRDVYLVITEDSFEEVDPNATPKVSYTIYVDNKTGWSQLSVYMYGDAEPAGWPGLQPTGTKEINGVNYTYFEMSEEMDNKTLNLIFNNNGNGIQLNDFPIVLNRDYYLQITESGVVEVQSKGFKIFVQNDTGWEALTIHYWGEGVTGTDWPGIVPAGTQQVNDITYTYFELPSDLNDKSINVIFNNKGAGEQFDGPYMKIDKDYYFKITSSGYEVVEN